MEFTCGIIVRILPVLRNWMVVLEDTVGAPVAASMTPVGTGSSLPTWMRAGRLSVARI